MTTIKIPVELTFSTLNAQAAVKVNTFHSLLGKPSVAEGDANPYVSLLNDMAYGAATFNRVSPMAESTSLIHTEFISLDAASIILGLGGDVTRLPAWFIVADKTLPCPFAPIPEAPEVQATWEEWLVEQFPIVNFGGVDYKPAGNPDGSYMNASQWDIMRPNVILETRYKEIQSQFAEPIV